MTEDKAESTYVGEIENLVFIVPKELFTIKFSPKEKYDREIANEFTKYLTRNLKRFQRTQIVILIYSIYNFLYSD